ncbi:MAG: alpha/beta fold hydrolase [Cycloclasticus sp.]
MLSSFIPPRGLSNPHIQTLWPSAFRPAIKLRRQRERIDTEDNDFFEVDWYGTGRRGVVILLHGLTGSSRSHYILGLQSVLADDGYRVAAINFRGCSGTINLKAGSYHAGFTDDIDQLYRLIRQRYPSLPVYSMGFSLGGNMMLKWLAEKGSSLRLEAAMAVSVPYCLASCADRVEQGFSKLYRYHLISALKQQLADKKRYFAQQGISDELARLNSLGDLREIRSFWQFDHQVVAALNGFDDVHDYYAQCSSLGYLKNIQLETLLINALDDPFMSRSVLPKEHELGKNMCLINPENGGHVGFMMKQQGRLAYWLESLALCFLNQPR